MSSQRIPRGVAGAALVVFLLCAVAAAWWRLQSRSPSAPAPLRFEGLPAFIADGEARRHRPVVFIGIDGADWTFVDPLLAAGRLPNLARLVREGARARLRSVSCYVSPPAWTSMMTGCRPERTGVYTFGKWDGAAFATVTAEAIEVPAVWDVASVAGLETAVLNVPMTYPARPVHGILASGIMTPNEPGPPIALTAAPPTHRRLLRADPRITSHSEVLKTIAGDSLNTLLLTIYDTIDDDRRAYDRVEVTVLSRSSPGSRYDALGTWSFAMGRYSPWLPIHARRAGTVVDAWCRLRVAPTPGAPDAPDLAVSPTFFRIDAPYTYPDTLAQELEGRFGYYLPSKLVREDMILATAEDAAGYATVLYGWKDWDLFLFVFTQSDNIHHVHGFDERAASVYETIDAAIGEIMEGLPPDAVLVIASDHGFGEFEYAIDLNRYLAGLGLLAWGAEGTIDHDRTLVFHNLWNLYFNRALLSHAELDRRGVASAPGTPDARLFDHLAAKLAGLEGGGLSLPVDIARWSGEAAGDAPDAVVTGSYDGSPSYKVDFWNIDRPHDRPVRRAEGHDRWTHRRDGILLLWGEGLRRGADLGTRDIEDVGPTLLYLLGLPIADTLDGAPPWEAFEPAALAAQPPLAVRDYALDHPGSLGEAEHQELERKLKSLGYIQ